MYCFTWCLCLGPCDYDPNFTLVKEKVISPRILSSEIREKNLLKKEERLSVKDEGQQDQERESEYVEKDAFLITKPQSPRVLFPRRKITNIWCNPIPQAVGQEPAGKCDLSFGKYKSIGGEKIGHPIVSRPVLRVPSSSSSGRSKSNRQLKVHSSDTTQGD